MDESVENWVQVTAPADVYLPAISDHVRAGDSVQVPPAVAESLIAQGWTPAVEGGVIDVDRELSAGELEGLQSRWAEQPAPELDDADVEEPSPDSASEPTE